MTPGLLFLIGLGLAALAVFLGLFPCGNESGALALSGLCVFLAVACVVAGVVWWAGQNFVSLSRS